MSALKTIFLKGWINPDNMNDKSWLARWLKTAMGAQADNYELVVFKIPKNKKNGLSDGETISEIEKMLQDKFL